MKEINHEDVFTVFKVSHKLKDPLQLAIYKASFANSTLTTAFSYMIQVKDFPQR